MHPIGVFDSGYGGLTIFKEITAQLPQYDYIYLGDNARVPYGTKSFDTIYRYTLECVERLFDMGCRLVILACNTASAKALRTIQQRDLPKYGDGRRVLGVIRPTAEVVGNFTKTRKVGIFATAGTVASQSYIMEIEHFFPKVQVFQEACPMWVPLIENAEYDTVGAKFFIRKSVENLLHQCPQIDTIILGCTHYPIIEKTIKSFLPPLTKLLSQDRLVAQSLADYLQRHPEVVAMCSQNASQLFLTTDDTTLFNQQSSIFLGKKVQSERIIIG